jgi:hypothetical protein
LAPLGLARARGAASPPPPPVPISLSSVHPLSRCSVGPTYWRQTHLHARAFSRCPVGPARQPVRPFSRSLSLARGSHRSEPSPLSESPAPRHGRAHVARFPATFTRTRPPFSPHTPHSLPSFSCAPVEHPRPLSRTHARPRSSDAARRGLAPVLRSPSSPRRSCCLDEFRLVVSNLGHPSVCPQPLRFARSALTGDLPIQSESATVGPRFPRVPAVAQAPLSLHSR